MEIKIIIKTPKGQAQKTESKIKPFIIGNKKIHSVYANKEDDTIIWIYNGDIRSCLKIQRNIQIFDSIIASIFQNKYITKIANKRLKENEKKELYNMLKNQTSIEILKQATADEIIENNETYWQRLIKSFNKVH